MLVKLLKMEDFHDSSFCSNAMVSTFKDQINYTRKIFAYCCIFMMSCYHHSYPYGIYKFNTFITLSLVETGIQSRQTVCFLLLNTYNHVLKVDNQYLHLKHKTFHLVYLLENFQFLLRIYFRCAKLP